MDHDEHMSSFRGHAGLTRHSGYFEAIAAYFELVTIDYDHGLQTFVLKLSLVEIVFILIGGLSSSSAKQFYSSAAVNSSKYFLLSSPIGLRQITLYCF